MPKDVHTEHCCEEHGCKYGDRNCTVKTKVKPQSFPCEYCEEDFVELSRADLAQMITNAIHKGFALHSGDSVTEAVSEVFKEAGIRE